MTTDIPATEPPVVRAGDTLTWAMDLPAYPAADGWALKYRLLWPSGASPVAIAAAGSGTRHVVTVSSASTAAWPAGAATLFSYIERAGERISLATRIVTILPDLATATAHDDRSTAAKMLAGLREALAAYTTGGRGHIAEYTIGDRTMKFRSAAEITALITYYERELARERCVCGKVFYRG